ncbi:KilA-N domain-containing protein [Pedobacter psychrodurus]|uniref:KilA-N domain-containing protein n=1 Tax=Pedobacter psychrodurus TaxID=2530456 RepID=UPI00292E9A2B|nr:KilA-N domain-containing protein [Pedobacter psychrodurus]
MAKTKKINVQGVDIILYEDNEHDFISLTDIARHKDPENTDTIVQNWMRNRNTIELLGFWETIYNPGFKPLEFEGFRKKAGLNSFVMTPKRWIEKTNAIGIVSKSGRYGGTFAPFQKSTTKSIPIDKRKPDTKNNYQVTSEFC